MQQRQYLPQYIHYDGENKRAVTSILGYGFYKSCGESSSLQDVWLPFLAITLKGNFIKPPFAIFSSVKLLVPRPVAMTSHWFGEQKDEIVSLMHRYSRFKKLFSRFGNLEALLISFALNERAWEDHANSCVILNKIIKCIHENITYNNYVSWIQQHFVLGPLDEKKIYNVEDPRQMKELSGHLSKFLKYHNNQNNLLFHSAKVGSVENEFPRFDSRMVQRIFFPTISQMENKTQSHLNEDADDIKMGLA